ncbi:hypothetical protein BJY52DRAFT_834021 [Lactarius psammicola]|nr:hypothetical protein BJY52DRAFT_834021 [Lactarius psammicola]
MSPVFVPDTLSDDTTPRAPQLRHQLEVTALERPQISRATQTVRGFSVSSSGRTRRAKNASVCRTTLYMLGVLHHERGTHSSLIPISSPPRGDGGTSAGQPRDAHRTSRHTDRRGDLASSCAAVVSAPARASAGACRRIQAGRMLTIAIRSVVSLFSSRLLHFSYPSVILIRQSSFHRRFTITLSLPSLKIDNSCYRSYSLYMQRIILDQTVL